MATHGIAEGAIKGGGEFYGIGQNRYVRVVPGVQRGANGGYAAVHHVRGGHPIHPGGGLQHGHLREDIHGAVIIHISAGGVEDTVVAGGGVGIESHVGDND